MMKKKCLAVLLCGLLSVSMLAGCGAEKEPTVASSGAVESTESGSKESTSSSDESSKEAQESTETGSTDSSESSSEAEPEKNPSNEADSKVTQLYMDFLNGKIKITTSENFREDDETGNYDGVVYGDYSYDELRNSVVDNVLYEESYTQYAIVNMGDDGVPEMAIQFKSARPSYMNWTGIVGFSGNGDKLTLNYSYVDGYRSEATLYQDGSLVIDGSAGAGAHVASYYKFGDAGFMTGGVHIYDYYGLFATNIVYDLPGENYDMISAFDDLGVASYLLVTEYKEGSDVKIYVSDWNEDDKVRAREEELVQKLVTLGAIQISKEEMDTLSQKVQASGKAVEWKDFFSEETETAIYALLEEGMYFGTGESITYNTENVDLPIVRVYPKRTITNVKVLALSFVDITEDGVATFTAEEKFRVETLKRGQNLMLGTAFAGDIPNNGISYVDANGKERAYSFGISGMDGSLVMSPIVIQEDL